MLQTKQPTIATQPNKIEAKQPARTQQTPELLLMWNTLNDPRLLTQNDAVRLQRSFGNQALGRIQYAIDDRGASVGRQSTTGVQKRRSQELKPITRSNSRLQRKCGCGKSISGEEECAECRHKRLNLQRTPIIEKPSESLIYKTSHDQEPLLAANAPAISKCNLHLDQIILQRACGSREIGTVSTCIGQSGDAHGESFLFSVNCDDFRQGEVARLRAFARTLRPFDIVDIHGFASEEGPGAFNENLSCSRAKKANSILQGAGIGSLQIRHLYMHSGTPGNREHRRSVVVAKPSVSSAQERSPERTRQTSNQTRLRSARSISCGGLDNFFRTVLLIDPTVVSDIVTCGCLGAGIADLVPGAGSNTIIEGLDCACNILSTLQLLYNLGADEGCWDIGNLSASDILRVTGLLELTLVDCGSLPFGSALGAFIVGLLGAGGGSATAGPPGAAAGGAGGVVAGAALGEFLIDLVAMAAQNLLIQGTPLPIAQAQACRRLTSRMR